jgi:hypothetical protein
MSVNRQAQSSNITTFDIYSNYDNKSSISAFGNIAELHLYESILDNTVRATAVFADTGNRVGEVGESALERNDVQLTAGEKTNLVVEDNYGQSLKFVDDYQLRIKEVRNIIEHNKKVVFTIDFYSKESIDNELVENRVVKRYDGKISDSVYKILKTDCIKTPKTVDIDLGLNNYNFLGGTEKPFDKLHLLASRCVPEIESAKDILAGYFFYETADNGKGRGGFKFKSIDKLFQQKPVRKLIFNNTTSIPLGYDAKILEYSFDNTVDLQHQLQSGGLLATQLKTWNPYAQSYEKSDFNSAKQFKESNTGGLEQPIIGKDIDLQEKSTKIFVRPKPIGNLPSGRDVKQQLEKAKEVNFDIDAILRQSTMRYNNLFTTKLSIAIPGDFGLSAGDLIHCDFPAVSVSDNQEISYRKSGLYMIVDLCHFIRSNPGQTFTRLNLVRESIGRKPF